jgi:hypothetical protein
MQKDFNHLNVWLTEKLEERRMSVEELSTEAKVSRSIVYGWLSDRFRPTGRTLLRVVHVLSETPVVIVKNGNTSRVKREVPYEEALRQFSPRVLGRPKGSGSGVRGVSVRSR